MKKTGLFKIIMFILLGIIVATWIFSASYFQDELTELGMYNIGLFDSFQLFLGSLEFSYFIQVFIFLLSVGALYGVLVKTGKYRALIDKIAWDFRGAELIFLLIVAFLIAMLTSLLDFQLMIFIFFPFLISIILAMGYDKITAAKATFGAYLVGIIGSTFGNTTSGTIAGIVSGKIADGVLYRFILFALSLAVLFFFLSRCKRIKKSENAEEQLFVGEKIQSKHSVAHVIIVLSVVAVLLILGCTSWSESFGVNVFEKINTAVTEFEIKLPYFHVTSTGLDYGIEKIAIFGKLLGTTSAFGTWSYTNMTMILIVASLVLGLCYGFKKETFNYMANGAKVMIKPAATVMLCYVVVYYVGNTMFLSTISGFILGLSSKFNILLSAVTMAIGSTFYVDILYVSNYVIPQIAATGGDKVIVSLLAQGIHGVTLFVAPTSAVLALGLTYLGIPYTEWIKKSWKLIVSLLALVMAVTLVVTFII